MLTIMTAGHTFSPVVRMSCTPLCTISYCIHPPPLSPCLSWIAVVSSLREPPRSRLPGNAGLGHEPVYRYPGYRAARRFFIPPPSMRESRQSPLYPLPSVRWKLPSTSLQLHKSTGSPYFSSRCVTQSTVVTNANPNARFSRLATCISSLMLPVPSARKNTL